MSQEPSIPSCVVCRFEHHRDCKPVAEAPDSGQLLDRKMSNSQAESHSAKTLQLLYHVYPKAETPGQTMQIEQTLQKLGSQQRLNISELLRCRP